MPVLPFSKWSPGGNTTLLFPAAGISEVSASRLASAALSSAFLCGEQAGFLDMERRHLHMAGGEFCVNASRAAAILLSLGPNTKHLDGSSAVRVTLTVSGWETPVSCVVRGAAPHWRVEAVLRLPPVVPEALSAGICLVRLPGISHLLLERDAPLAADHAEAGMLRHRYGLDAEPAAGVIWWRRQGEYLEMLPLVRVRDAGTEVVENACGSGALALALHLARSGRRHCSVSQPGGSALEVRLFTREGASMAGVDGPVDMVARGQVWLPDAGLAPDVRGS